VQHCCIERRDFSLRGHPRLGWQTQPTPPPAELDTDLSWDWTSAENTIVAAVIVAGLTVASLIAIGLIISRMVARCC
jgi:hypothetical protein